MIEKLVPPTDNLYKFMAISGLLLIVLAYLPEYYGVMLYERNVNQLKVGKILMVEIEQLKEDSNLFREKYEKASNRKIELIADLSKKEELVIVSGELITRNVEPVATKTVRNEAKKEAIEIQNEIDEVDGVIEKLKSDIHAKQNGIRVKDLELEASSILNDFYGYKLGILRGIGWVFFLFGLLIATVGFYAWYAKVQQFSDVVLANQIDSTTEINEKKRRRKRMI